MKSRIDSDLDAGQQALERGAWEEAFASFHRALEQRQSGEAWEGVGVAAWWLEKYVAAMEARENAYRLYSERGEKLAAARMANWLALDSMDYRNELAVASGWLGRAARLLEGAGPHHETGFLILIRGHLALMADNDPARAREAAAEGLEIARTTGSSDVEILALALGGLARVSEGDVSEGMKLLDESTAAALGGEVKDLNAVGVSCCYMIHACERVRDYDRASQWCLRVREFCRRWRFTSMFTVCRLQYSSLLMHRGDWAEAEKELLAAIDELRSTRPAAVAPAIARLAELRRRQGRREEATELFESVASHRIALLGRGELALEAGDGRAAMELADQLLRRIPRDNLTERAAGLDLLARAAAFADDAPRAMESAGELEEIASAIATDAMMASARAARGAVTASRDPEEARRALEDAADLFDRAAMPFEAARTRAAITRLRSESAAAAASARSDRGAGAGQTLETASGADRATSPLTAREIEVVKLVAQGLGDKEIAERLFLSPHTVHRHVSNVLTKLDLPSRAAAVAQAARLGLLK